MLTKSQAGEFEIDVSRFELDGDDLVMIGAMGVWEARTHIAPVDVLKLLRVLVSSGAIWVFMCKLPFLLLKRR